MAQHVRARQVPRDRPQSAMAFAECVQDGLAALPDPASRVQALYLRAGCNGRSGQACLEQGDWSLVGIDETLFPQMVKHSLPITLPEGVDDEPTLLQKQRHRPVGRAVARCRNIGAATAIIEITAEGCDYGLERHGGFSEQLADVHQPRPFLRPFIRRQVTGPQPEQSVRAAPCRVSRPPLHQGIQAAVRKFEQFVIFADLMFGMTIIYHY